jgi:hypothetical protein
MELLSQLDVQKPDHVSIITRDNRVTISVTKDGSSVTLGFPLNGQVFDVTPRLPLQQTTTKLMAVKGMSKKRTKPAALANAKLTQAQVREIKGMLADAELMQGFGSKHRAYKGIGDAYKVSYHTISNIHKGLAWRNVTTN